MDKHLDILKQLFIYYWNSDKPVLPSCNWELLGKIDHEMLIKDEIYYYFKYE